MDSFLYNFQDIQFIILIKYNIGCSNSISSYLYSYYCILHLTGALLKTSVWSLPSKFVMENSIDSFLGFKVMRNWGLFWMSDILIICQGLFANFRVRNVLMNENCSGRPNGKTSLQSNGKFKIIKSLILSQGLRSSNTQCVYVQCQLLIWKFYINI